MTNGEYLGAGNGTTKLLLHLNGNSTDSSGNGNNGTDTNITYSQANGKFGQGAGFNGTSSVVNFSSFGITGNSARTYGVWIKPSSVNVLRCIMGCVPNTLKAGKTCMLYQAVVASGDIMIVFNAADFHTAGSKIIANEWNFICFTYNGTSLTTDNVKIYINGVSQSLTKLGTTTTADTLPDKNRLGYDDMAGRYFNGAIDEVIIENRAWTASEVKKYYTYAKGRFNN